MKINTITCHHVNNHGAMLQAYALITHLQSLHHEASIIDYRPDYLGGVKLWHADERYKRIELGWLYILAKLPQRLKAYRRQKSFDKFFEEYLPVTRHYEKIDELMSDAPEADCYIAGSDQIWNTTFRNGTDPAFYLDFGAKETLRLSYAASFATDSLRKGTEDFVKSKLANFDSISVRERSAIPLLRQLGYEGIQVVDPVFLLSADDWDRVATHEGEGEDYILVYDFMKDTSIRSIAKRMAKMFGCKIYSIGSDSLKYADSNFWKEGPTSFLSLVKNARCIVSNSFHGSAFSMIYGRDFFVVNRKDGLNARMRDLHAHYNIPERLIDADVSDVVLHSHINYSEVQPVLQYDISESKKWLLSCLSLKRINC